MVNDHTAREQALDPAASFIVQAPAGSGKTALLVYRILRALASVQKPEQVLAITFTRKATAEMRERLLELLQAAEAGEQADNEFEQQGLRLAHAVLERDKALGWQLLDAPDQLQLHTIDAFCARLSGDMPWLSRMGDKPGTTDNATHLYNAAVDALLNSLLEEQEAGQESEIHLALTTVMLELDFDYARARRLFSNMLVKRDQWLRHLVQNDLPALRDSLQRSWQELLDESLIELENCFSRQELEQLISLANDAAKRIPADKPQMESFQQTPINHTSSLSLGHWRELRHLLSTGSAEKIRARVDKNTGFPTEAKDDKLKITNLLASFAENERLLAALQALHRLPNANYSAADWSQLVALEKVLLRLAAQLQLQFRSSGECDHSEVAQRALRALHELHAPTDLALRIDYQLHHILVDEFQDTSRSQLELLRQLTAGWQANDGRSLFLVGDPMQSIYRFREADVSLFLQVANNAETGLFDNLSITPLQLSENFRSSRPLVDWFNQTFAPSFPSKEDVLSGAIRYAPSSSHKDSHAHIKAELVYSKAQEASRVIHHVRRCLEQSEQGTVAILVRSRSHLSEIIKALDHAEISFSGVDIKPLAEVAAIQDIVTLCKAIARPHNRLAWLALLRSPLLGLSLGELYQLRGKDPFTELSNASSDTKPSLALARFLPVLTTALSQRQQCSLASLTAWAWQTLGGQELQQGVHQQDIDRVLEIVASLDVGGDLPSLNALDEALAGLYAQPNSESSGRVVLSTIHKAKGLQYRNVILPGLDRRSRNDDKDILMWAERSDGEGEPKLLLAPIRLNADAGKHFDYLRHLENQRSQQERVRQMYVACTRAERDIVLLAQHTQSTDGEINTPVTSSLLSTVWDALQDQFDVIETDSIDTHNEGDLDADSDKHIDQTLTRLPAEFRPEFAPIIDWQGPSDNSKSAPQDEDLDFAWATELATGVGMVLHSWLEVHSQQVFEFELSEHQQQQWRAELQTLRVPEERLAAGTKRLTQAVRQMQADDNARFIFADHHMATNELALSSYQNGELAHFKIDRTFVDDKDTRWIVDYKTTTTRQADVATFVDQQITERHRPQLENYGRLMRELDARPIMLAVYFPLLGEFRSWPYKPKTPQL